MRKRRSIITTILALLVLMTALPAFSLKAQAAGAMTAWKLPNEYDNGDLERPTRYKFGTSIENATAAYCLNRFKEHPTEEGIGDYTVETELTILQLVGGTPGKTALNDDVAMERKLIDIFMSGFPNGKNPYPNDLSDAQFQTATQYAVWYYTDSVTPKDDKYFMGKVGADLKDARVQDIINNWDKWSESEIFESNPLSEAEEKQIATAKKMIEVVETLKDVDNKKTQSEYFYAHNKLEIYTTTQSKGSKTMPYQNFAGIKTIVEDPSKEFLFSKDDANGSKEIEGAKLIVEGLGEGGTDGKGAVVREEWKSEAGKSHKIKLYEGEYKMTEITAPDGYEVAESIIFRVVKNDNGDLKVERKDGDNKWADPQSDIADNVRMKDKRWTTPVSFSKTAVNGTEELPGATLKVVKGEGTDGEVVEEWKSTTEQKKIELMMGTYTMIEITAPKGYEKAESIIFRVTKDKKIEIKQPDGSWATLDQSVVHMEDAETPEEPKKEDPKPEEPKKEDPKPEEPKKEDPKPEEPKKEDPKPQQPEQPSNPAPEQPAVDTPDPVQPAPTPAPAQDNVAVLGATRTEDNVEQVADPGQAAVLGSRRSPETADPAPLTTLVVLAGSSLVGILTLLVVWHDANHAPRKKRR